MSRAIPITARRGFVYGGLARRMIFFAVAILSIVMASMLILAARL